MEPARQVIREFRWREIIPGLMLVRVFRSSLRIHALVLSFIASLLIAQGWKACAVLCLPENDPIRVRMQLTEGEPRRLFATHETASINATSGLFTQRVFEPLVETYDKFARPAREFFSPKKSYAERGYYLLGFGWTLLVGSFFAGVICRTAAFDLASQERYGVFRAIRFVATRLKPFLAAPLIPLVFFFCLLAPIFLLGLLTSYVSPFLASLLWGFALLWGLLLGMVAMIVLFAWPLLWPAIAIEDSDSFDAIGSSFGFVSQRPLTYVLYIFVAAFVTSAGLVLFSLLIQVGMSLLTFGMVAGGGQEVYSLISASSRNSDHLSSSVMSFWEFLASFLTDAYLFSAFWTSATGIFLLMRHHVDGAELDDIYRDGSEDEKPMPKLAREMGLTGETASMTSPVAPPAAKAD